MPSRPDQATDREARETRVRRRRLGVMAGVGAVGLIVVVALGAWLGRPAPAPIPSTRPAIVGDVARVFYELVAGRGTTLLERLLDGRSVPRVIAQQPGVAYARVFTVGPDDRWAIAAATVDDARLGEATRIATIDLADGTRAEAGVFSGTVDVDEGVWSGDGTAWATRIFDAQADAGGVLLVDLAAGRSRVVDLDLGTPFAFEDRGNLLLQDELRAPDGTISGWRFNRLDAATGEAVSIGAGQVIAPAGRVANGAVSLAQGAGLDIRFDDGGQQRSLAHVVLHDLRSNAERELVTDDEIDWATFEPGSRWVATCGSHHVRAVSLDGTVRELFADPALECVDRGRFSTAGGLLGLTDWDDQSVLRIVDVETGRAIVLPLPKAIAEAHLVAVHGESLPLLALPAAADPVAPPAPSGGTAIAGSPTLIRMSVEHDAGGQAVIRGIRQTAGDSGGLTTISTMAPIPVPQAGNLDVAASGVRSPVDEDVLVRITWGAGSEVWRWHRSGARERLRPPDGWPQRSGGIAWSPDGRAVAADRTAADGTADIVLWELASGRLRTIPLPADYTTVEGWPAPDRILVGHTVCTEGCPGRYAFSLLVDTRTGKALPLAPDGTTDGRALHQVWSQDHAHLTLDAINEDVADDRVVDWPHGLPVLSDVRRLGERDLLVIAGDPIDGLILYRMRDAVVHALAGEPQTAPELLGRLPAGAGFAWLSADGRWAATEELASSGTLVELATGREFAMGDAANGVLVD